MRFILLSFFLSLLLLVCKLFIKRIYILLLKVDLFSVAFLTKLQKFIRYFVFSTIIIIVLVWNFSFNYLIDFEFSQLVNSLIVVNYSPKVINKNRNLKFNSIRFYSINRNNDHN